MGGGGEDLDRQKNNNGTTLWALFCNKVFYEIIRGDYIDVSLQNYLSQSYTKPADSPFLGKRMYLAKITTETIRPYSFAYNCFMLQIAVTCLLPKDFVIV